MSKLVSLFLRIIIEIIKIKIKNLKYKYIKTKIAKNIVLAGVHSLTIIDSTVCRVKDLGSQFYINQKNIDAKLSRFNFLFN